MMLIIVVVVITEDVYQLMTAVLIAITTANCYLGVYCKAQGHTPSAITTANIVTFGPPVQI